MARGLVVGKIVAIVTLLFTMCAMVSCSDGEDTVIVNAALSVENVDGDSGSCAVVLTAQSGIRYVITIESGSAWCKFADGQTSLFGQMDAGQVVKQVALMLTPNKTGKNRVADIKVEFAGGMRFSLRLTQYPMANGGSAAASVLDKAWAELPVCEQRDNIDYRYYTDNVGSKGDVRNYTICFDRTKKAALWVAYPLHSFYTSGVAKRNDDFVVEPSIPSQYQPDLTKSYAGYYDRGHQIAAADRKCSQTMMDQTFYWTNMTPQQSNFNQKLWGNLEGKVRGEICADTLYVVTGAYFDGEYHSSISQTTNDSAGKSCPIPTHYYKLLLRTVSGRTGKAIAEIGDATQLQAIGIYIQHHDSGSSTQLKSEYFMSVSQIEQITGFDFFPMLDDAIEAEVESQCNPSVWF